MQARRRATLRDAFFGRDFERDYHPSLKAPLKTDLLSEEHCDHSAGVKLKIDVESMAVVHLIVGVQDQQCAHSLLLLLAREMREDSPYCSMASL